MQNAVVHIVLPKGMSLTDGRTLKDEMDLVVVGEITPWYASIDEVRLEGGIYLTKLPDLTIAAQIKHASDKVDVLTTRMPHVPPELINDDPYRETTMMRMYNNFMAARNHYTMIQAAYDCIMNVQDLLGARGSKTLANFSMSKMEMNRETGLPKKLTEMAAELKGWKPIIQSGGHIGFGGHALSGFAAKGKYDPSDGPAGRLWMTTGMGANHKTVAGWGSAGKPVKYGSPAFMNWRVGRTFGNYISVFPKVIYN